MRLFPDKACKKHGKQELTVKTLVDLHKAKQKLTWCACLKVKSYFVKRQELLASMLSMLWIETSKGCGWLVQQPVLSKTLKIYFLSMSAITHNWSFFATLQSLLSNDMKLATESLGAKSSQFCQKSTPDLRTKKLRDAGWRNLRLEPRKSKNSRVSTFAMSVRTFRGIF